MLHIFKWVTCGCIFRCQSEYLVSWQFSDSTSDSETCIHEMRRDSRFDHSLCIWTALPPHFLSYVCFGNESHSPRTWQVFSFFFVTQTGDRRTRRQIFSPITWPQDIQKATCDSRFLHAAWICYLGPQRSRTIHFDASLFKAQTIRWALTFNKTKMWLTSSSGGAANYLGGVSRDV